MLNSFFDLSYFRKSMFKLPKNRKLVTNSQILGRESFARWLVSLALALEIELVLALDIERYHITASINHLTCPLPPHQSDI